MRKKRASVFVDARVRNLNFHMDRQGRKSMGSVGGVSELRPRRPPLPALTGLRFFAAAHVVLFHYVAAGDFAVPAVMGALAATGQAGVSLFFVLSGFILTYAYLTPGGALRGTALSFWRARVARVYPLYALALVVAFPLLLGAWFVNFGLAPGGIAHLVAVVFSAPLLIQSWTPGAELQWNGPGWSLSVEAFFYLLFPLILPRLARMPLRRAALLAGVLWAATATLRVLQVTAGWDDDSVLRELLYRHPVMRLPDFVAGIVACRWFQRRAAEPTDRRVGGTTMAAIAGGLLLAVVGTTWVQPNMMNTTLLIPLYAALFVGLAEGGPLAKALGVRPLQYLGEISYALYLLHVPVHVYVEQAAALAPAGLLAGPGVAVASAVISLLAAALAYRFVELPWRERLRHGRPAARREDPAPLPAPSAP